MTRISSNKITWGMDGYGTRHFICGHCWLYFGTLEPGFSHHDCDTSKPPYENRDRLAPSLYANEELLLAAEAVIERWDSPKWKDEVPTAEFINRLRRASNVVREQRNKEYR